MKINNLELLYFRNYTSLNLDFHPSLNILVGNNANGKTNIVESIFYLALAKSFRTRKDSEAVQFGQEAACISCELVKDENHIDIMLAMNDKGKNAKIGGSKKSKLTDFVGELNVVLFSPDDLQLIKGSPSLRREFIDREFYQFSRIYHKSSLMYKHLLKQRNAFLKDMRKDRNDEMAKIYLEELTLQLAKIALFITRQRNEFVKQITYYAQKSMDNISDSKEKLDIVYKSSILESLKVGNLSLDSIDEKYVAELMMKRMHEDINTGSTRVGIHQDDLIFYINSLDAKVYASQGQQRSIVLSLRLAEIDFLKKETGYYPVLLLDDVLSELDKERQSRLLDAINENIQTFITAPSISDIKESLVENAKVFYINQGNVEISK
ncbi:MAG: DNA replication/repair protein RecF [Gemella sp.]|nr:DNA replication/repair protein RecF [Gemella sp.]